MKELLKQVSDTSRYFYSDGKKPIEEKAICTKRLK